MGIYSIGIVLKLYSLILAVNNQTIWGWMVAGCFSKKTWALDFKPQSLNPKCRIQDLIHEECGS